jgi:hypothetical protein
VTILFSNNERILEVKDYILELSVKYSKESTNCSKLGIKWLKWGEYTIKIEDNNSMRMTFFIQYDDFSSF